MAGGYSYTTVAQNGTQLGLFTPGGYPAIDNDGHIAFAGSTNCAGGYYQSACGAVFFVKAAGATPKAIITGTCIGPYPYVCDSYSSPVIGRGEIAVIHASGSPTELLTYKPGGQIATNGTNVPYPNDGEYSIAALPNNAFLTSHTTVYQNGVSVGVPLPPGAVGFDSAGIYPNGNSIKGYSKNGFISSIVVGFSSPGGTSCCYFDMGISLAHVPNGPATLLIPAGTYGGQYLPQQAINNKGWLAFPVRGLPGASNDTYGVYLKRPSDPTPILLWSQTGTELDPLAMNASGTILIATHSFGGDGLYTIDVNGNYSSIAMTGDTINGCAGIARVGAQTTYSLNDAGQVVFYVNAQGPTNCGEAIMVATPTP